MAPVDVPRRRPGSSVPADHPQLVAQLGGEVAAALSSALERVHALASSGRIDRAGLHALREEIDRARRVGMMGQQLGRLASGGVPQAPEPQDLATLLRDTLEQRRRETERRGLRIRQTLQPSVVLIDATLAFALLQTLFDWALEQARGPIALTLGREGWPAHARLACSFAWRPLDLVHAADAGALETMSWHVLVQTARTLGLPLHRADDGGRTELVIEFPRTVAEAPRHGLTLVGGATHPVSLAGAHVLVLAARREVRAQIREALKPRGTMMDFVTSVDEAREFCRAADPHAVIHEAALGGEHLERLRHERLAAAPRTAFVQITEDGRKFELGPEGRHPFVNVGRAAIADSLPAALAFALSR